MNNLFLVAVDGSASSDRAVEFAIARAKLAKAKVVVAYVIEWSPYSFNTPEENAERHKRREAELARADEKIVGPVKKRIADAGIDVSEVVRHGHPAETLLELAESHNVSQIFIGRKGQSGLTALLFGSVAANLVQTSSVPVTVVP